MGGFDESLILAFESIVKAGVHSNTNTYIDPSNSECIKHKSRTFRSIKILIQNIKYHIIDNKA